MVLKPGLANDRDGIMPEIYGVSAEYQSQLSVMQVQGYTEDSLSTGQLTAFVNKSHEAMMAVLEDARYSITDRRKAITTQATLLLRLARKMRIP
jgi:hypothetical protein